jgi:hypothetical protein
MPETSLYPGIGSAEAIRPHVGILDSLCCPWALHLRNVSRIKAEQPASFRSCWPLNRVCNICPLIDPLVSLRRKLLSCTECYRPSSRRPISSPSSRERPVSSNHPSMSVHFWHLLICHTSSGTCSCYGRLSSLGISLCEYSGCFSYPKRDMAFFLLKTTVAAAGGSDLFLLRRPLVLSLQPPES